MHLVGDWYPNYVDSLQGRKNNEDRKIRRPYGECEYIQTRKLLSSLGTAFAWFFFLSFVFVTCKAMDSIAFEFRMKI